jgi:hypothetical protein
MCRECRTTESKVPAKGEDFVSSLKGRLRAALVVFVAGLCGYGPSAMGGIFAGSEDTV